MLVFLKDEEVVVLIEELRINFYYFLEEEVEFSIDFIDFYLGYEIFWCYRWYIFYF